MYSTWPCGTCMSFLPDAYLWCTCALPGWWCWADFHLEPGRLLVPGSRSEWCTGWTGNTPADPGSTPRNAHNWNLWIKVTGNESVCKCLQVCVRVLASRSEVNVSTEQQWPQWKGFLERFCFGCFGTQLWGFPLIQPQDDYWALMLGHNVWLSVPPKGVGWGSGSSVQVSRVTPNSENHFIMNLVLCMGALKRRCPRTLGHVIYLLKFLSYSGVSVLPCTGQKPHLSASS